MVAEAYLLPLPTADPGTWAPMSPAQVRPGCVLWTRWRPRRRLEPEKSRDAQEHGKLRKLEPEEKYDVREEEDLTWRTWSPCVSVAAERHATSAPPRRTLRRPAIQAALEDGPGATRSAGHPRPRQRTPGLWIRGPSPVRLWDSEGHSDGYRTAYEQPSESEETARPPTRANTAPEPSLEHDDEALERPPRARTAPVARHTEPTRDIMGDTPMAEESEAAGTAGCAGSGGKHAECHCEHVSFLMGKYPKMGMDAIVHRLDSLDNAKDGLEEDVAGILDDQSAAERDIAELRAEQAQYRENLELALEKQQRVVDSLLHLVEDMSGRLKRLEERQLLTSGPELPAKPAAAELVERVKTLRSAMDKPMGGPAEAPYAPPRVDPGALPFVPMFSESTMLGEHTAPAGSMRKGT